MCYLNKSLDSLFQCAESLNEVDCKVQLFNKRKVLGKVEVLDKASADNKASHMLKRLVPLKRNLPFCTKTTGKKA